jgi:protein-S-isoprenylcysteine O-methyltransferase Ste14
MTGAPRRAGPLFGSFLFLVFVPGTIAGYIPYTMTHWRVEPPFFDIVWLRGIGAAGVFVGVAVLADSFLRFALEGRGTPAPVVPPEELVVSGLYRFVRNPMYVAVLCIVFGQALLLGSTPLLVYSIALWVAFQSFVMLYEEPTLRMKFGRSYDVYCANVSRWLPRLRPWRRDRPSPMTDH